MKPRHLRAFRRRWDRTLEERIYDWWTVRIALMIYAFPLMDLTPDYS